MMSLTPGADFNLQTSKKEDVSTRLKSQNLKRAKTETRKLEQEGRKMEERLSELKFAMTREKEERERQGGGFWRSGTQNNGVTTYADEVLSKNKKISSAGKTKIKILKDKPLDLPERKVQPGTLAYIAQRGATTPRDRPRGPKCGQCEERSAAVSCVQCSEDYCAGCFAAFHLRGNLKKHRSVPLSATPRQCFASPRPGPAQSHNSVDFTSGEKAVAPYIPNSARKKDRNSPEGASGCYDNSLLGGEYNEADQASSFQEALQAWRVGKAAQGMTSEPGPSAEGNPTPRGVAYSPVRTPTVNVDSATGTMETEAPIEIKFNTSNLSYADRLLLKKHRRTDVETLFTPREGADSRATPRATSQRTQREGMDSRGTPRATPRATPRKVKREKSSISMRAIQIEDVDDADFNDGEERVDFRSLFEAIQTSSGEPLDHTDPDSVSIVEVQELASSTSLEQTGTYKIQEEGEAESWSTDKPKPTRNQKVEPKPPMSGKTRRRSARKSARSSIDKSTKSSKSDLLSNENLNSNNKTPAKAAQHLDVRLNKESQPIYTDILQNRENSFEDNTRLLGARLIKIENAVEVDAPNIYGVNEIQNSVSENHFSHKPLKSRPESAKSRPATAKSRPQTGRTQSRAGSRQGSRPASRANSRAASRIDYPGVLTKGPSDALREIARMTPTADHEYKGLTNFLMMGVEGANQGVAVTPRSKQDEKIKVSNQLYNMAPRSWKPDFSIADSVPVDNIENDDAEDDRAHSVMAYAVYSEQMVSEMTERLVSRFGELPIDEDSLSDHSSGGAYRSLGEEYRTFTPRSSQNSPSVSGRATPVQMARFTIKDSPSSARDAPRMPASRARGQTPRASQSRSDVRNPRRSTTFHDELERPVSRAIVMEGTDLSIFDNLGDVATRNQEDEDALDQLEWELASNTGRLTDNGKLSRMEIMEDFSTGDELDSSLESIRSMSRLGHDKGYDINIKLKDDELEDERDASFGQDDDEYDVRALH